VDQTGPTEPSQRLIDLDHPELTVEWLVARRGFEELFPAETVATAERRLGRWASALEDRLRQNVDKLFELARAYAAAEEAEPRFETEVEAAGRRARSRGYYTREEFLLVCDWKTGGRARHRYEQNDQSAIEESTRAALSADGDRERIEPLLRLQGVGWAIASALLSFSYPESYPLFHPRAAEWFGLELGRPISTEGWLAYLELSRNLANRAGVSVRVVDKTLLARASEVVAARGGV
jgi:hypothetical protein